MTSMRHNRAQLFTVFSIHLLFQFHVQIIYSMLFFLSSRRYFYVIYSFVHNHVHIVYSKFDGILIDVFLPLTMHIIKYSIRMNNRRLILRTCRFVSTIIFIFIVSSFFLLVFYSKLNYYYSDESDVIVSLTSTPRRFQYELPFAIHSLLSQIKLPKETRIYLSTPVQKNLTLKHLKAYIKQRDSSVIIAELFDKLVQIRLEKEDYGPATKFLPILKEFHTMATNVSKTQAIMICDDDHYYHPHTIATLIKYSDKYKNSIVGLRGWRIREDLIWGVLGEDEFSYHVVDSFRLSDIYRVGIVTANSAYLIRPWFFDSHIYLDFNQAPADIRRVDDIWLNGYASRRNITRFVVPACCSSIGVTQTHELENYFGTHKMSRASANNHALRWFNRTWEKDLWYRFNGENRPRYLYWWVKIYQKWIGVILGLKFIIYFGFV